MLTVHPHTKWLHITCALASGGLFAVRGLLLQAGCDGMAQALPVRLTSYAIDTTLLTAALMLVSMLPHALYANGWLATKLALLVVYVGLGVFAMRRHARSPRVRGACYAGALATYGYMIGIARMHHPLGWFVGMLG